MAAGLLVGVCAALVPAVAHAHEPVFVTAADATPAAGPLLEDGNHSFAVYGVLPTPDATRGFRMQLVAGQPLVVELLVPDLSPERDLAPRDLPEVSIRRPDGTTRTLPSNLRVPFDEPFSQTSYVRIAGLREPAAPGGVYELTVAGRAPARFTLATGTVEGFGGAVRDVEPAPPGGLAGWYATPPPKVVAATPSTSRPRGTGGRDEDSSASWSPGVWFAVGAAAIGVSGVTVLIVRRRRRGP